jgi:hypothetical protein
MTRDEAFDLGEKFAIEGLELSARRDRFADSLDDTFAAAYFAGIACTIARASCKSAKACVLFLSLPPKIESLALFEVERRGMGASIQ